MKQTLRDWVFWHLSPLWHCAQLEAISFFCMAAIEARTFIIAKVGQRGGISTGILPRNGVKRLNRLLKNKHFTTNQMNDSSIANFTRYISGRKSVVLVIDWTQKNKYMMLAISFITENGRTVPIAWDGYSKGEMGETQSQNKIEEELLRRVIRAIPHKMKITILADRGFDRPEFIKFLRNYRKNIQYVIRVTSGKYMYWMKKELEINNELVEKGKMKNYSSIEYTKERKVPSRFVAVWRSDSREPWLLLTNIKYISGQQVADLYSRRMSIEAMFRSMKNEVSGLSLKHVRLQHIQRWLVLCFLATLLLQYFWEITQSLSKRAQEKLEMQLSLGCHRRRYGWRKRNYSVYYLMLLVFQYSMIRLVCRNGTLRAYAENA